MDLMRRLLLTLAVCSGMAAGCGDEGSDEAGAERQSGTTRQVSSTPQEVPEAEAGAAARRRGPLVRLGRSQFGPVLFSGRRRAVYLFTRDRKNATRCYGACARAWPPFFAR
jgi:predicted lipoprotein with Yx(FWY)xxD motif